MNTEQHPPPNDTDWLDDNELAAWVNLIKLSARIITLSDNALRRHDGITGRDYEMLHHLSNAPDGLRLRGLAERIDDTSSCITHRVNRLKAAGLVAKRIDPTDQRARIAQLTPRGRELLEQAALPHAQRVRRWIIDPLDHTDITDLTRIANKLNTHLQATEPCTE
ncbi:MAG: MarR family winged helix-turn-helix transcriptional regulator [Acidimicrobiales bacterium]